MLCLERFPQVATDGRTVGAITLSATEAATMLIIRCPRP